MKSYKSMSKEELTALKASLEAAYEDAKRRLNVGRDIHREPAAALAAIVTSKRLFPVYAGNSAAPV